MLFAAMRTLFAVLKFVFLFVIAFEAAAQFTVTALPPNPKDTNIVALHVSTSTCPFSLLGVQRTGNSIRIDVQQNGICIPFTLYFVTQNIGVLPAGTYTWQLFSNGSPIQTGSFAVSQSPGAPALSPAALAILAAALALGGSVIASRR
jgi:hypothetical protein